MGYCILHRLHFCIIVKIKAHYTIPKFVHSNIFLKNANRGKHLSNFLTFRKVFTNERLLEAFFFLAFFRHSSSWAAFQFWRKVKNFLSLQFRTIISQVGQDFNFNSCQTCVILFQLSLRFYNGSTISSQTSQFNSFTFALLNFIFAFSKEPCHSETVHRISFNWNRIVSLYKRV